MDDVRDSFSKLKKDLKQRLRGKKNKPDSTGAKTVGENVDSSGSLPQPEPTATASNRSPGEGSGYKAVGSQVISKDQSPQPEPGPAGRDDDDRERREADEEGDGVDQSHSRPEPDVEVVVDSGPSREVEQVHPSPSTPSIPPSGKPDRARTCFFFQPL